MKKLTNIYKSGAGLLAFILINSIFLVACSSNDDGQSGSSNTVKYSGTFTKSNSSVTTSATGTVTATLNKTTNELAYTVNWNNLTSTIAGMHFHDNGPIIAEISGFATSITGTYSNKAMFTATQVTDLGSGKIYVQIHTANYPGGEVIATLSKTGGSQNPPSGY
ncbi:CHRD domain-containing protein [Solitalea sp. MAHUQ-68]|uniref:CHRD domain-containing protein n=1 Tax=Solitalea agri TaxID=2953739 RepID=A0A9X2F6P1_9SPHI|nr:CHRD domain-containing protein [Solitalea agri]MCO4293356.1 CHRD domain-containing protein [Solitalea agri]